jgi:hypothetical protein
MVLFGGRGGGEMEVHWEEIVMIRTGFSLHLTKGRKYARMLPSLEPREVRDGG